jgi:opacity protein-like surface antigen
MGTIVKAWPRILGATLIVAASPAVGADLANPGMTIGAPAPQRWDGVYFGVNVGGFMSPSTDSSLVWFPEGLITTGIPNSVSMSQSGVMGGAQIGFNKQWGGFVLGAEADYDFTGGAEATKSASGNNFGTGVTVTGTQQLQSLGTMRLKVGFAPIDDLLIYATGGLAFGTTNMSTNVQFDTGVDYAGNSGSFAVGYALGGGVEYAFDANWSVGAQFLYYDLGRSSAVGTANVIVPPPFASPDADASAEFKGYVLRLTLNYEFSDIVMPASYGHLPDSSEFAVAVGVRGGFSNGGSRWNLYGFSGAEVSRLTYRNTDAGVAEIYAGIEDRTGLYGRAYAGVGRMSNGTLQDEDFPPGITPYSSTNSSQQYGSLSYGTIDVGYFAYQAASYKFGGFAGWNFLHEELNAFGCTQTATNPDVCPAGAVAANNLGISDNDSWNAPRLGVVGEASAGGFTFRAEAAWLPIIYFSGDNSHFLRIPQDFSGPIPESGIGHNGYELEADIDYWVSPNLTVGVGARYWSLNAKGNAEFQDVAANAVEQGSTFETERFEAYAQTAYHF